MAQRFYFDLRSGHDCIRDDEGVEASDLDQATGEAEAVLGEMRGSKELSSQGGGSALGDPQRKRCSAEDAAAPPTLFGKRGLDAGIPACEVSVPSQGRSLPQPRDRTVRGAFSS